MRYKELIDKMTLEEKASLMSGKDYWQSNDIKRLGIDSMFLADGTYGIRKQTKAPDRIGLNSGNPSTCFPTSAAVSNSWNESLAEKMGIYLGKEAVAQKVNILLGPAINIKRNPLCGRNFEYFSEDPFLSGKMAAGYIRGIQSNGIAACVKHFAVNNQESRRMAIDSIVDERTLREIYLTAFEIAIDEGNPKALMSSYNKVNGEYANENIHLMKDILREEWGYRGCVITEWGGSNDRIKGLLAGNELEMPSNNGETNREIINAVKSGELDEKELDEAVDRLLKLIFNTNMALEMNVDTNLNDELHHRAAQRVAEESIVLLKNEENILPIKLNKKVAVIGDFAKEARYQGAGSSIVNPTILDHTMNCFEESGIVSIGYEQGFDRYGNKDKNKIHRACELAKSADVVLLYIGLDEFAEVEGIDRTTMSIHENQIELLNELYKVNKNIVAIISAGCAIEMPWIDKVKGLVHGFLGGQAGARSILRVLSGDVNPSGKLTETYPLKYEDTPSYSYFPGKELTAEYKEGIFVGYRYYDTVKKNVLFPFGYGLSYTTFEYSNINVNKKSVTFTIKNTGNVAGMEVAQLYVSCKSKEIFRANKELKGFAKIFINAGEEKKVTIKFDDKTFRYFDIKTNKWEIEAADYDIMIGASCADIRLIDTIAVDGSNKMKIRNKKDLKSYYAGEITNVNDNEFAVLLGRDVPRSKWDKKAKLGYNDTIGQCKYSKGVFGRIIYYGVIFAHWFLIKTNKRYRANQIIVFGLDMPLRGISRMTAGKINMPMLDGILIMINGNFFKGLRHFIRERKQMKRSNEKTNL